jgi:hypothetical protein
MPVNIQGRSYATVAERLEGAHGEQVRPTSITSIITTWQTVGEYLLVRAEVTFADSRLFVGTAEVTRGTGRGPQSVSPIETAETSAVGRALAMAGWFGSGDGIAGAEEVRVADGRAARAPSGSGIRVVGARRD